MIKLRVAVRAYVDFELALRAQIAAHSDINVAVEIASFDLRTLEEMVVKRRSDAWDLAIFPTDWIGAAAQAHRLEALTSWMEASPLPEWPEGWPASLREPLRQGGAFFCIPWHDGPECLIYRRDLFEDPVEREVFAKTFARELAPPTTWNEFYETAGFFTRTGSYGTVFAAYPDGHNTLYDLVLQIWSRAGELHSAAGSPCLDTPVVVEALDFYRALIRDPSACYPACQELDSTQSGDVFLEGKIAMMVNWFGFAARASRPGSPLHDRIALAPIPGGVPGQTASLSNYWVIGISADSIHKDAAYELLQHIASPAMDKLTTLNGAVGVRLSTWHDPDILQQLPIYHQLERLSATARTLPFCPDLPRLAEIVNQVSVEALSTDEASHTILARAQAKAVELKLRLV